MGIGGSQNNITLKFGVGNLADDILVCESHNQAIFGGVVFVLGLDGELSPGTVVSLTLPSSPVLDLEPLEVGLVFYNLDETLKVAE